jgi:DNA-binding HxlR family transcriptional regulator
LSIAEAKRETEIGERAGTRALTLLSTPIDVHILRALAARPKALIDLRREVGSPPQTTMRAHLRTLTETGIATKRPQNAFPGALDIELTASGHDLWAVAEGLRSWLAVAPGGPVQLGSAAAKSAIKALVDGWSTSIVRALAAKPLSLTELDSIISGLSYPSLERRLGAMHLAGQIEKTPGSGRGTPYAVTEWLRHAVAPLAAAARWERLNVAQQTTPITRLDTEAAFLLAIPLLTLRPDLSGACRLAVELQAGTGDRVAGVVVTVNEGQVASCVTRLQREADAWVSGPGHAWLQAVIERDTDQLEIGGHCDLARALLDGLHDALFGAR